MMSGDQKPEGGMECSHDTLQAKVPQHLQRKCLEQPNERDDVYACFYLPEINLYAQLREDRVTALSTPCVLATSDGRSSVVLECNTAAEQRGIERGFSIARARARCEEEMRVFTENAAALRMAQRDLLGFAERWVGEYESTSVGCVILSLSTLPPETDWQAWCLNVMTEAYELAMPFRLSLAHTPDLAHLAVQVEETCFASREDVGAFAVRSLVAGDGMASLEGAAIESLLVLAALDWDVLEAWGLECIGDLLALDKQDLTLRMGSELGQVVDVLEGKYKRHLTLHETAPTYTVDIPLDSPLQEVESLLFLLHREIQPLCAQILESGRVCQHVTLVLLDEQGESYHRKLQLAEPSCDHEVLRSLLYAYLDSLQLKAPVDSLYLALDAVSPIQAQEDMLDRKLKDPNRFETTLTDLQNLMGRENVGRPVLLDTHRDDAFRMERWTLRRCAAEAMQYSEESTSSGRENEQTAGVSHTGNDSFLCRYRPRRSVQVLTQSAGQQRRPKAILTTSFAGVLQGAWGPYPSMGEWWQPDRTWNAVEWDVLSETGISLRLLEDLQEAKPDGARTTSSPAKWYLLGYYF